MKTIKKEDFIFLLIFMAAIVFYLFRLGFSDLWSDEIYTKSMLEGSLADSYTRFRNDLHPPLYYMGLRLFTAVFGLNTITLRLFSVLGVWSTILLGYFAGRRIFGKQGALYFCLMLISIPMLAVYSHQARMYTWGAFSVTGVFIYAYLFMKTGKNRDLTLLFIFTLLAMYIHYYSMAAAFVANVFVLCYMLFTKNKKWRPHLFSCLLAIILFLPWLFMFLVQIKKVQHAFWAPEVSLSAIFSCFTIPFTEQFWTDGFSLLLTVVVYALIAIAIFLSFTRSFSEERLLLWLSLSVFLGTLLLASLVSLFSQSILSSRYVMTIVTMLVIPPVMLFMRIRFQWLRIVSVSVLLLLGLRVSLSAYSFSYGPYWQTIQYLTDTYPDIKKMLHITEITAGPMVEYSGNSGLIHCWLKAEMSNVDAFTQVNQYNLPDEFLKQGEEFCAVRFNNLDLNIENLNLVLSESQLIKLDTIRDDKFENGIYIQLYLLKYMGR